MTTVFWTEPTNLVSVGPLCLVPLLSLLQSLVTIKAYATNYLAVDAHLIYIFVVSILLTCFRAFCLPTASAAPPATVSSLLGPARLPQLGTPALQLTQLSFYSPVSLWLSSSVWPSILPFSADYHSPSRPLIRLSIHENAAFFA
ncbi:unnamed protein product [Protopolystoma xenopodis]|uniref:Uncharacterized protein n=1 Tax=Protopolystoma xenopodis TaxID=117903 RepID=A0A3S5BLK7_9PLAT|nr:unnamed protein product [Protopolystoma xenopodis]